MTPSLHVDVVSDGDASGGAYAVLDVRAEAGTALRPHVSHREDTILFVVEGESRPPSATSTARCVPATR